jgi:uncharacterized integral membrane protein
MFALACPRHFAVLLLNSFLVVLDDDSVCHYTDTMLRLRIPVGRNAIGDACETETMTFVIVLIIVASVVLFSIQNAAPVEVTFLAWKFQTSLAALTFISFLGGVIVTALVSLSRHVKRFWVSRNTKGQGVSKGGDG